MLTPIYNPYLNNAVLYCEASWSVEKCGEWETKHVQADTPTLALLKALAAQWRIEV
jgi:hypothetical protein